MPPLTRLSDLISWFRVFDSHDRQLQPLPKFNILGPDNSGTLRKMVLETKKMNGMTARVTVSRRQDDKVVQILWQELAMRGVISGDHVAIISEQDTYYARALSATFIDVDGKHPNFVVDSYKYLRGIDGQLPSNELEKQDTPISHSSESNKLSSIRPTEKTEGLNQADDIRRLAKALQKKDVDLRNLQPNASLRAIGLLGSDVYDKWSF